MENTNLGTAALRELSGGVDPGSLCDGPVEITLREQDFQVISVADPGSGQERAMPTVAKMHFVAQRFRELLVDGAPSGIWELTVLSKSQAGDVPSRVFLDGAEILLVKKQSKVL